MFSLIKKIFFSKKTKSSTTENTEKPKELTRLEKRNNSYSEFFKTSQKYNDKVVAIKPEKGSIFSVHVGYIIEKEISQFGVVCPVIEDILTGKKISGIVRLLAFNEKAFTEMAKLNKGQFLTMFGFAHDSIDSEMECTAELSNLVFSEEKLSELKNNIFFDKRNLIKDISYVANFWSDDCIFNYETSIEKSIKGFKKENIEHAKEWIDKKTLMLYISNENSEPSLSVLTGVEFGNGKSVFPVFYDFKKNDSQYAFGFPHVYSETLKSCFEKMPKSIFHAVMIGTEKPDNPEDIKNGTFYKTYDIFCENIEKQKIKYQEYLKS